jgi:hypothetical protein
MARVTNSPSDPAIDHEHLGGRARLDVPERHSQRRGLQHPLYVLLGGR